MVRLASRSALLRCSVFDECAEPLGTVPRRAARSAQAVDCAGGGAGTGRPEAGTARASAAERVRLERAERERAEQERAEQELGRAGTVSARPSSCRRREGVRAPESGATRPRCSKRSGSLVLRMERQRPTPRTSWARRKRRSQLVAACGTHAGLMTGSASAAPPDRPTRARRPRLTGRPGRAPPTGRPGRAAAPATRADPGEPPSRPTRASRFHVQQLFGQAGVMADNLTLMAVHAHPDDEASSTGGVLALHGRGRPHGGRHLYERRVRGLPGRDQARR